MSERKIAYLFWRCVLIKVFRRSVDEKFFPRIVEALDIIPENEYLMYFIPDQTTAFFYTVGGYGMLIS